MAGARRFVAQKSHIRFRETTLSGRSRLAWASTQLLVTNLATRRCARMRAGSATWEPSS